MVASRSVPACLLLALLAAAAPAAADPPADAFCVILIEPSPDFSLIRVLVDEDTTLEAREELWPSVDVDDNGVVSPVEKDAFRWSNTQGWPDVEELGIKAISLQPGAPYVSSPAQKPVYAATWRQVGHVFHKQDYELPDQLTRAVELETQEVREFGFQLEEGRSSRFTIAGGRGLAEQNLSAAPVYVDEGRPVIEYVVIHAPKGWVVESIEGASYNGTFVLEPDERSVDVPAFDTKRPYTISFLNKGLDDELGELEGPAPAGLLVALGLLGAAFAVRRRR
ncbi:MAG TPA: hypothetical protein VM327_05485 [Candidatus Thermoplasmatota archaeon]|nr:hypothetical protein [Candidatus Thermoplasmatota archaeon]